MSNLTVKSFDEELRHLHQMAIKMGDLACHQLEGVLDAVEGSNSGVAARIIEREPEADRMEHEIEGFAVRVLALRQPMARDLREVLAALRIAKELERICDYAADLAERVIALRSSELEPIRSLGNIGRFAANMVRDALGAYSEANIPHSQIPTSLLILKPSRTGPACQPGRAPIVENCPSCGPIRKVAQIGGDCEEFGLRSRSIEHSRKSAHHTTKRTTPRPLISSQGAQA